MRIAIVSVLALSACAAHSVAPPPTPAPPAAVQDGYVARGNEPFWLLDIGEALIWRTPDGEVRGSQSPAPAPLADGTWLATGVLDDGRAVEAAITPRPCQDSMSGQSYPDTVRVRIGREVVSGCGGEPMEVLVGDWTLVELFGQPALQGGQAGMLTVTEAGHVSGTTGCNRFFGQVSLTGEGLEFSGLGMTRMACLDAAINAQETRFMEGLNQARQFRRAGASLILETADGRALRFEPQSPG